MRNHPGQRSRLNQIQAGGDSLQTGDSQHTSRFCQMVSSTNTRDDSGLFMRDLWMGMKLLDNNWENINVLENHSLLKVNIHR